MKKEFKFQSKDKVTQIHGIMWIPKKVKAVLQINHGMQEYIDRYDSFAKFLNEKGILVVGHDHLGHGESVTQFDKHGYFNKDNGNECVIGDIHTLRKMMQKKYSSVPYFMLGHSMGSFLTRQYITKYGDDLTGVIIMGTGHADKISIIGGKFMCRLVGLIKGDEYRSSLIDKMAIGSYNKAFEPAETSVEWLTKDREIINKYISDPWCTFMFTVNAYYHMLSGIHQMSKKKNINKMPKDLPIFFVSGDMDPVGDFGKGVEKVYSDFVNSGMRDVKIRLYKNDRHEILNEVDKDKVYNDIYKWIEEKGRIINE